MHRRVRVRIAPAGRVLEHVWSHAAVVADTSDAVYGVVVDRVDPLLADDGPGFDARAVLDAPAEGHLGLRVLRDLATDAGAERIWAVCSGRSASPTGRAQPCGRATISARAGLQTRSA